jgi:hypothetical protein
MSCLDDLMKSNKSFKPSTEDHAYGNIVTFLEGLADFHPKMVSNMSAKSYAILADYYWFGRHINVDDIFVYRRTLVERQPGIKHEAECVLRDFLLSIGVDTDPADYAAWS